MWLLFLSFPTGSHLPGRFCLLTEAPGLASCSVMLRVFDKLSWTLHVAECQFVKYPKCGTCLTAPGQGSWDITNKLLLDTRSLAKQKLSSHKLFSVTLKGLKHCIWGCQGESEVILEAPAYTVSILSEPEGGIMVLEKYIGPRDGSALWFIFPFFTLLYRISQ